MKPVDVLIIVTILSVVVLAVMQLRNNKKKCGSCCGCPYSEGCAKAKLNVK